MATNHWQPGRVLDVTNGSGADVLSGDLVLIGEVAGVALVDIPAGSVGSVQIEEVFILPKTASEAIAAGTAVYLDATTKTLTATATDNTRVGVAVYAAGADDATVKVKLNA